MKYFNKEEFCCKCCGGLPPSVRENIEALVENVLDPAREKFGGPILVNSGYRCMANNPKVGGVQRSQHLRGEAADISCADNEHLAEILEQNGKYDQLIRYQDALGDIRFIHVSWKRNGVNRKMKFNK